MKKNIPILGFIVRYWILLLLVGLSLWLATANEPFKIFGAIVYLPTLTLGSMAVALLVRHSFLRHSSDEDVRTGRYEREWDKLTQETRVKLTVYQLLGLFLGTCLIASALIK